MARSAKALVLVVGAAVIAATAAGAQTASTDAVTSADARLAWAKRHVELVCRPLEARQMFDKATRCYNDVARIVSDASKSLPVVASKPAAPPAATATRPAAAPPAIRPAVRTAARPAPRIRVAARPVPPASPVFRAAAPFVFEPVAAGPRRCTGVACLQYTMLGVGF